jgi:predicted Zn-dependent protease
MIDCSLSSWTCVCSGQGLRWQKQNVTYLIDDEYTNWQKELIRAAFDMVQARVKCMTFREVSSNEDIFFNWIDIDGRGKILAQAQNFIFSNQVDSIARSIVSFDRMETVFNTDPDLFFYVAIHELLHALGLDHAPSPDNILFEEVVLPLRMSFGDWDLQELFARYCSGDSVQAIQAVWMNFLVKRTHIKLTLRQSA